VGSWLARRLLEEGHAVTGTVRTGRPAPNRILTAPEREAVAWRAMELGDPASLAGALGGEWDAVVHLAAVSGSNGAQRDPATAWQVNAVGTANLLTTLASTARRPLTVLVVSTGEVYGSGEQPGPRRETDPVAPRSAYAWSKAGAELAALSRQDGGPLEVMVARPFPHTGPGQVDLLVPRWLARLREGAAEVTIGDPDAVRDYLDVRDVVEAYRLLLERGRPGTIYNVARGSGMTLGGIFESLRAALSADARLVARPDPARTWDVDHLVGDPARLITATGWAPRLSFEQTLRDMIDAEAH
jgi:GDP-4-dehydro-6-deoxy-D-mannose reductase